MREREDIGLRQEGVALRLEAIGVAWSPGAGAAAMQPWPGLVLSGGFSTVLKNNPSWWGLGLSLGYWWLPIPVPGWDILDHICEASVVTHGALPEDV